MIGTIFMHTSLEITDKNDAIFNGNNTCSIVLCWARKIQFTITIRLVQTERCFNINNFLSGQNKIRHKKNVIQQTSSR